MTEANTIYPVTAVRTLALWAQGLATANGAEPLPTPDAIHDVVARLGCVQIDTLQMVRRSHYLAVWSRLGCYTPADFDRLIYAAPRRLFEDWLHAACILPLTEYRYRLPYKRRLRTHGATHTVQWLSEPGNVELLAATLERIRKDGAVGVGDFEYDGPKRGKGSTFFHALLCKPMEQAFPEEYMIACDIERKEKEEALNHLGERINLTLVDKLVKKPILEAAPGVITVKESLTYQVVPL